MDRDKLVAIAGQLFEQHGLTSRGWRLEFRNYADRLGCCCSKHSTIALNAYYVEHNEEAMVIDTLLHEIAHALVGSCLAHGPEWKAMAMRLGCFPRACSQTDVVMRPGKWQASCPTCARLFHKHRRPKYVTGYYCPSCGDKNGKLAFTVQISDVG